MNKVKKNIDFKRMAAEAKEDADDAIMPLQAPMAAPHPKPSTDVRLQKLLENVGKTVILPTEWIIIEDNIRQIIDVTDDEFKKLCESIRTGGVKQNLLGDLRVGNDGAWRIVCVAGQRRLLAAMEAKIKSVPVKLEQYSDEAALLVDSLSENILRKNLHPLDIAIGYLRLFNLNWSAEKIAESFEREKDTVMKMLRLARYPQPVHEVIRRYPEKFTSAVLLNKFVSKSWADTQALIQALEDFANLQHKHVTSARMPTAQEVKEIESLFSNRGMNAKSRGSKENGTLTLSWNSLEEFNEIESLFKESITIIEQWAR